MNQVYAAVPGVSTAGAWSCPAGGSWKLNGQGLGDPKPFLALLRNARLIGALIVADDGTHEGHRRVVRASWSSRRRDGEVAGVHTIGEHHRESFSSGHNAVVPEPVERAALLIELA